MDYTHEIRIIPQNTHTKSEQTKKEHRILPENGQEKK